MDPRMETNEFFRLIEDYPKVAFNYRSFTEGPNTPDKGFEHLCVLEPYIGMPENWNPEIICQYKSYICWNKKFMEGLMNHPLIEGAGVALHLVSGSAFCNHYAKLDIHPAYNDRLPGICVLNKLYHTGLEGDIIMERDAAVRELDENTDIMVHVFSPTPWGGDCYRGPDGSPIHHSHQTQLARISHYRFSLCFESSYHSMWSYDFMTERLFNAFKAKTMAVYLGCYNIEEWVPEELFIDVRKFKNYTEMGRYMESISEKEWHDTTEAAFEWERTCSIGRMANLEAVLRGL